MSILATMDLPTIDVDLGANKIEDDKQGGPLFHCNLCDTEVVHKLAQMFLPGLASASVDNTTGGLFKTPGSVTVDFRKEMIQYLTLRSESFVAESVILQDGPDGEVSDHPFDIISNFVDDFASSKRNFFSRVSAWLLSEKREDKIDDFIQEIDMNGFWTLDRRQVLAETLLKNVDFKNLYHCTHSFSSSQELSDHVLACNFRPLICQNQGCNARFCAAHLKNHDSICPFKIIPCEQRCSSSIMRRDMDRHCITACPMKLVNCPFYTVGCRSAVAQCMIEKHCSDDFQSHVWHMLKGTYKEVFGDDLQRRVVQIVQASPSSNLSKARDVRSLTFIVKNIEATLGPMEITVAKKDDSDDTNTNNDSEQKTQESDMVSSSDKVGISDIIMRTAENTGKSEESENIRTEIEGREERIQTSNITNLPDEAETVHVSEGTTQSYKENNDAASSEFKFKDSKENTQTNMEKLAEEVSATNEDYVPNNYKENNDAAASDLKFKGHEEDTQTNMEKLAEEISATNEDYVHNNSIKNGNIEDDNFEDNDNVQSIQNSNMEKADSAENNVKNKDNVQSIHNSNMDTASSAEINAKNKDTEDDNLK